MGHKQLEADGIRLVTSNTKSIKSLLGFKPSHQVPKNFSPTTNRFAKQCAEEDIASELDLVWSLCRVALQYKRNDKQGPAYEEGSGSITFPDFRVSIRVSQDENHPEDIIWHQSVDEIRSVDFLLSQNFNEIFSRGFDYLEADFLQAPDIDGIIDKIEELEPEDIRLSYPADCSSCEIYFKSHGLNILITPQSMQLKTNALGLPKVLAEKFLQIRTAIYAKEKSNPWAYVLSK